MKKPKNENKKTIRILDKNDNVIETTEAGLPASVSPQLEDVEEELHSMQGYRDYVRHNDSNHGLTYGDY